jgi:large subunit ribosomal protein L10
MNRDQKAAVVDEIAEQIKSSDAIFAVDYRGISVEQAADLRVRLRESGTRFRIVKNSLTERAADQAGAEALKALLEGPTALAFVTGDAALAAKALNDAARTMHTLEFKGGLMDSAALSAADVVSIARLPAREVLHAQLVGTIAAPITGLVRGLNALIAGLAIQLKAIADQGLVSGEAPAAAPEAPAPEPEPEPQAAAAEPEAPAPEPEAPAPEPEAEAPAAAEPEPAAEAQAEAPPSDTIVDVEAEPGATTTPDETDQDVTPDEEPGA